MNQVDAQLVKSLRERTGAGLMACKRALVECEGDVDKAIRSLREQGLLNASTKSGRLATEGLVYAHAQPDNKIAVLVEVNCETDFVAKNPRFRQFIEQVAKQIAATDPTDAAALLALPLPNGNSIEVELKTMVNVFGENLSIRRFARFTANCTGFIGHYIHNDYLTDGKLGVLIEMTAFRVQTLSDPEFPRVVKTLLMHVAAAAPASASTGHTPDDVQTSYGVQGLLEQSLVVDPRKTVGELIQEARARLGDEGISVVRFVRFERGEPLI